MRLAAFFVFLALCFTIFSCSHNPYEDFQTIHVGEDKGQLLEKVGSPVRSRFENGQDIWTYRFYVDDKMIYKEVVLQDDKVKSISDSQNIDLKAIEEKEKKLEEELKKSPEVSSQIKPLPPKKKVDDSELYEKKTKPDDFEPVD
jgi:hypothetical protein